LQQILTPLASALTCRCAADLRRKPPVLSSRRPSRDGAAGAASRRPHHKEINMNPSMLAASALDVAQRAEYRGQVALGSALRTLGSIAYTLAVAAGDPDVTPHDRPPARSSTHVWRAARLLAHELGRHPDVLVAETARALGRVAREAEAQS